MIYTPAAVYRTVQIIIYLICIIILPEDDVRGDGK